MTTLVIGSNRKNNATAIFAKFIYQELLKENHQKYALLDLSDLTLNAIDNKMYGKETQPSTIIDIQDNYFLPAEKFWFFVPEYNGSIPGILKLLIDGMSVRLYEETFSNKKACITGIASGRAGNLRGMDHLAEILNHLNIAVLPNKLPISSIHRLLDKDKTLIDSKTMDALIKQKDQFLQF